MNMFRNSILFIILLCVGANLFANSAPIAFVPEKNGGNPAPIKNFRFYNHPTVSLQNEELKITLHKYLYSVRVRYVFKNEGEACVVNTGFPHITPVVKFRVFQDGKKIKEIKKIVRLPSLYGWYAPAIMPLPIRSWKALFQSSKKFQKSNNFNIYNPDKLKRFPEKVLRLRFEHKLNRYHRMNNILFPMKFKKNSTTIVELKYSSWYGRFDWLGGYYVNYILDSGRFWKGKVKKLNISVKLNNVDYTRFEANTKKHNVGTMGAVPMVFPLNYKFSGKSISWKFRNVRLSEKLNLELYFLKKPFKMHRYPHVKSMISSSIMRRDFPEKGPSVYASWNPPKYGIMFYSPYRLLDSSTKMCWAEGVKGSGVGEWFEVTFKKKQNKKRFGIINGLAFNKRLYGLNNRVKSAEIVLDGKTRFKISFKDRMMGHQWFDLPRSFKKFKFIIKSVYQGKDIKGDDTCLQWLKFK